MRRGQRDGLGQPVRNLATGPGFVNTVGTQVMRTNLALNPGFEVSSGTTTVRTNLATNPSFETSSGTVSLRTNLCQNPSFETGSTGWGSGPNWTVATSTAQKFIGTTSLACTRANATTGNGYTVLLVGSLTAGLVYTLSYYVYGGSGTYNIQVNGSATGGTAVKATFNAPGAVWTRQSLTFTASATGGCNIYLTDDSNTTTVTAGTVVYLDSVLLEQAGTAGAYFDGATAAAGDFTYLWNGTAHASTSYQRAPITAGWVNVSNAVTYQTKSDAYVGTYCTAINVTGIGQGAYQAGASAVATAGSVYTLSAYVKGPSGQTFELDGDSANAVNAWAVTNSVTGIAFTGAWQRVSTTFTAPAGTTQVALGIKANTAFTGTILVDAVLVEQTGVLNAYYDGTTAASGDFTYGWTGTAHASTSIQKAPNAQMWSLATLSAVYQSSISPMVGAKCGAVQTNGANGDGTYVTDISVVVGTTYTSSVWVKLTSAVTGFSGVMRFKDSGNGTLQDSTADVTASLVVGSWVRVSVTGVAPVNAVNVQAMWRVFSTHTPTVFYLDGAMVEAATLSLPYFDGATAAAGDFTYNWSGTANITTSVQRSTMISAASASRNSSNLDSRFFVYQSTDVDGKKTCKWLSPANTGQSGWRVAAINSNGGWDYTSVKAGGRYTLFMRYRGSGWGAGQTFQTMIADGGSTNQVVAFDTSQPLNTAGWVDYRRVFTAVRDATTNSVIYTALQNIPQTTTDGIFEIRDWMLVAGEYTGDMIDGAQPFSKWDGTANQSTSVGYPQQLSSIVGTPTLSLTSGTTGGVAIPVGAFDARTIYLVYEAYGLTQNYPNFGSYGIAASKGITLQTAGTGSTALFPRLDFPGGSTNIGVTHAGGRLQRRHVVAFSFPQGLTQATSCLNGGADRTDTWSPGTGWDDGRAGLASFTEGKGMHMLVFYAEHDRPTRVAMSRYLGNKYGVAVA